jgi:hypothetical protein
MTTPTGTIKASDIRSEFGATSGDQNTGRVSLGAYRVNQTVSGLSPLPLDTDIPNSVAVGNSAISFRSFRGKKLNVVIDYTVPQGQWKTTVNARLDYNNNTNITVIGGFKTRPSSPAGTKVIIHTNGNIGSYVYLSRSYRAEYVNSAFVSSQDCYTYYVEEWGEYATYCDDYYDRRTDLLGYLHFYPTVDERDSIQDWGLAVEDPYYIRIFPRQEPDTVPLYLLYLPNTFERYYTIKYKEVEDTLKAGWKGGYAIGYVYSNNNGPNREAVYLVYKLYKPSLVFPNYSDFNRGEFSDRLYTKSSIERDTLISQGWTYYGEAFYAPAFVSDPSSVHSCSLLTGTWPENTDLKVDIGPSGGVYGAGGVGGRGGNTSAKDVGSGSNGGGGNSALGIQYTPIVITNRGKIVGGGGGGGGGNGKYANHEVHTGWGNNKNRYYYASAPGSGGGGGRGFPGGAGGASGTATWGGGFGKFDDWNSGGRNGSVYYANAGKDGSADKPGGGGSAKKYSAEGCEATGGAGGAGGDAGVKGGDSGATGGSHGYAIIISSDRSNVTINGNPEVGGILPNTNPV